MENSIGIILSLFGFAVYFSAFKLFVEVSNYYRLISDSEKRRNNYQTYASLLVFLGFVLTGVGLMCLIEFKYFDINIFPLQSILKLVAFLFFQTIFIWFNVLLTKRYYWRYPIIGKWVKEYKYEIEFEHYDLLHYTEGNGVFKIINFKNIESHKFLYSINYKRMKIKIKWLDNIPLNDTDESIPSFIYSGNHEFEYKMKDCNLFFDNSIGILRKK